MVTVVLIISAGFECLVLRPGSSHLHDALGRAGDGSRHQGVQRFIGIAQRAPEHGHVDASDHLDLHTIGQALLAARVRTVVFGAWDPKAGACGSVWDLVRDRRANHWVEVVGGLDEAGCGVVLREFFRARR